MKRKTPFSSRNDGLGGRGIGTCEDTNDRQRYNSVSIHSQHNSLAIIVQVPVSELYVHVPVVSSLGSILKFWYNNNCSTSFAMAIPIVDHSFPNRLLNLDDYVEDPKLLSPQTSFLTEFGPSIYLSNSGIDGNNMVVIALQSGVGVWVWNPLAFHTALLDEIMARCGGIRHIVVPKYNQHLFEWTQACPAAKVYIAPGITIHDDDITTDFLLTDTPMREYAMEIDQLVIRGSHAEEVIFFHKPSQTILFCDFIQRNIMDKYTIRGFIMHQLGYVNSQTSKRWKLDLWLRGEMELTSRAKHTILHQWKPTQLISSTGDCAPEGAMEIIQSALAWIPDWKGDTSNDQVVTLETSLNKISFTTGKQSIPMDQEESSDPCHLSTTHTP